MDKVSELSEDDKKLFLSKLDLYGNSKTACNACNISESKILNELENNKKFRSEFNLILFLDANINKENE